MVSVQMLYNVKMCIPLVPMASVSVTMDSETLNNVAEKVIELQKKCICILNCDKLTHI